jgi:hypothetical protein
LLVDGSSSSRRCKFDQIVHHVLRITEKMIRTSGVDAIFFLGKWVFKSTFIIFLVYLNLTFYIILLHLKLYYYYAPFLWKLFCYLIFKVYLIRVKLKYNFTIICKY